MAAFAVSDEHAIGTDFAQHARRQLPGERAAVLVPDVLATDTERRTLRHSRDVGEVDRRRKHPNLAIIAVAQSALDGLDHVEALGPV